jgi:hypothetical protein
MKNFVLSRHGFDSVKDAEKKVNIWYQNGQSEKNTKLYKVIEVYDQVIRFKKRI